MRRTVLCLLVLATAGLLAAPALSSRPYVPPVAEFGQALDPSGWTGARDGMLRSPVLRAPRRFDLVGLRWSPAPGERAVEIRVRDAGGRWGRWTLMAADHAAGAGAEPVWAGGADAYQLRIDGRPRGLRARFVNTTGSATAADRVRTALRRAAHAVAAALVRPPAPARAQTGGSRTAPAIIPREAWGADRCPPRAAPAYGQVQLGVVHHTVSANTYAPQDSAALVLAICRYHRNDNGWRDIGYNFLVDRYGQIFEGRSGGIDQAVIGAQVQGYNGVSTGVANIGTHSGEQQTQAGISATADLLAWKLSLHGAPVAGQVRVTSAGGPSNRYPAGRTVTFERISGHRDADRTSCPGDALFAQLPQIRAEAAALAPRFAFVAPASAVSLDVLDRRLDWPEKAELSGRVTDAAGAPVAGAPVSVQIATGRAFRTLARATSGADGGWTAQLATQYSRKVRAIARMPDGALVSSAEQEVEVAPRLRLRAPRRVSARRRFTVRGTVRPRRPRVVLEIAREGSDKRMHTVARVKVVVRRGRFTTRMRLRRAGLTRLRVLFPGDARNVRTRTGGEYLRAVRRR